MTDSAAAPADDSRMVGQQKKGRPTPKRDETREAEEKISLWGRIVRFVRQTIGEMKKVRYPTNEELWQYFLVVVGFVAVLMAFTGTVDMLFDKLTLLVFV